MTFGFVSVIYLIKLSLLQSPRVFITSDTVNTNSFLMDVRLEKAGSICPVNPLKDKFLQIKRKKRGDVVVRNKQNMQNRT